MEFHPISGLDVQTSPEVLAKAHKLYERESLNMRLKALQGIGPPAKPVHLGSPGWTAYGSPEFILLGTW
jgi:hypothetical protein